MLAIDSNAKAAQAGPQSDISPEEVAAWLECALRLLKYGLIEQPGQAEASASPPAPEQTNAPPPAKDGTDAAHIPPPSQTTTPQPSDDHAPSDALASQEKELDGPSPNLNLAMPSADASRRSKGGGVALGVPAARALPAARDLSRSLRPLRLRTDSRIERELDVDATVELRADRGAWQPVWRPVRERWLDLVLVCDTSRTMILWRDTLKEWQLLLQQLGAFRDVRVWSLDTQDADCPTLRAGPGGPTRHAKELVAPGRARLIMLATDCLGPAWFSGQVAALLDEWGRHQPVALLQMLPHRIWDRTALTLAQEIPVGASLAACANVRLPHPGMRRDGHSIPCPVMTFESATLHTWALLVRGALPPECPAVTLPLSPRPRQQCRTTAAKLTALERIERFEASASDEAFRLACLLAAAPLRLPVMRLIQQALMASPSQVHLAEFYLSGLIQRVSPPEITDPNLIDYAFRPDVREAFLNTAQVDDLVDVQLEVSNYLRTRFGQLLEFHGVLAGSESAAENVSVQPENAIFAQVAAEVLLRLGGQYANAVKQLQTIGGGTPAPVPPPTPSPLASNEVLASPELVLRPSQVVPSVELEAASPEGEGSAESDSDSDTSQQAKVDAGHAEARRRIEEWRSRSSSETLLDLSKLDLTSLPLQLAKLSTLTKLNLSSNRLTRLPPEIGQLSALSALNLSINQFTSLPPEIAKLSALTELRLSMNRLTSLPSEFSELSALTTLDLDDNQFRDLPLEIAKLFALTRLNLSGNQLSSLPPEITQLSVLKELHLSFNQFISLPPEIGQFSALTTLDLSHNHLTSLPPEIQKLTALEKLYLHDNPDLGLPEGLLGPRFDQKGTPATPGTILQFYFSAQNVGMTFSREFKLVVLGAFGAGKTALIRRLMHGSFDPGESESTDGIALTRWVLATGTETMSAQVWEFGSRQLWDEFYSLFLTRGSLYLLVLSESVNVLAEEANAWLRTISAHDPEARIIVVSGGSMGADKDYSIPQYPGIRSFHQINLESGMGVEALERTIIQEANQLESPRVSSTASWQAIKERVARSRTTHISFEEFRHLCTSSGVRDVHAQEALAQSLNQAGVVLNFEDQTRQRFLLKPQWLARSFERLLNDSDLRERDGEGSPADFKRIFSSRNYPPDTPGIIREVMEKLGFCLSLGEDKQRFLCPALMRTEPPPLSNWHAEECLVFEYRYKLIPRDILPRFIARTYELSRGHDRWRTGVMLNQSSTRALIRSDQKPDTVTIWVSDPSLETCQTLLEEVRKHFAAIHEAIPYLDEVVSSQVPIRDGDLSSRRGYDPYFLGSGREVVPSHC